MTTQNVPQLDFSQYANWLKWRAGRFTAGPPQLLAQYGIQLEDWRIKPLATLYGLAEVTGIPTLVRWGQAIFQNRPIAEVEKEYFSRIAKDLQQAGINVDEKTLGARVGQATMHAVLTALPLAVPLSRQELAALAKSLAVGFGAVGAPTAFIRTAQGYPDETLKAFIETGLAGTVITDAALILRNLAAGATPEALAAIRKQIAQRSGGTPVRVDDAFMKEVEEAILALKRGDTSKYDALLKKLEEWQKKVEEFQKLYETRQRGPLPPEDETRYTRLLKEVSEIRDRYETLKMYIETAREMGLEAAARRLEFDRRTLEDLARAARETPPGPSPKDLMQWLQRVDLDFLQKLVKDPDLLSRYARRFGIDEQTLAERAALVLRARHWERIANLPTDELKRILMDESLLKKYADEFNVGEDRLRELIESLLQQRRVGAKSAPEPERPPTYEKPSVEPAKPPESPASEKPSIEPIEPKRGQFRSPEVEVGARGGQVLIVRAEEELKPTVKRLEKIPTVEARLRYLLMRRRLDEEAMRGLDRLRGGAEVGQQQRLRETGRERLREETRQGGDGTARTTDETPGRTADTTPGRTADGTPTKTADDTPRKTADIQKVTEREVLVLDRDALRTLVPALPAYVFTLPAPMVLAMISRTAGIPIALAPGLPRPSPRESFGSWLDRVFAGTGFTWRSLAAQKETFVFA